MHVHCMYVATCSIECVCVGGVGGGPGHRDMQRIVLSLKFMISAFFW